VRANFFLTIDVVFRSGDLTMFEAFWRRSMGEHATVVIPGRKTVSYFCDVGNLYWFLEPGCERESAACTASSATPSLRDTTSSSTQDPCSSFGPRSPHLPTPLYAQVENFKNVLACCFTRNNFKKDCVGE
jgi:hypothetical protein